MKKTSVQLDVAGKTFTFETGELAQQATASILARLGDTMVLATVVEGKDKSDLGYFPLSVEYVERLYAGGRIKGSRWVKREGRPTDDAILTARLIDRSIRPLFPKEYKKEVQVVVTVLSVDGENEPDILAINAVSLALAISRIPWAGPIGATKVGYVKDKESDKAEYIINPSHTELAHSDLEMVVSQTKEKTLMIEAGALQISEEVAGTAVEKAFEENKKIVAFIEEQMKALGEEKGSVAQDAVYHELCKTIEKNYKDEIVALIPIRATKESSASTETEDLIEKIFADEQMKNADSGIDKKLVAKAVEYVFFQAIRERAVKKQLRPDGRKIDEVREITSRVSVLPRTHGSAIFKRGDTQVLTIVTLGTPRMEQLIESAEGEESKRYIHHYSMPPYSVGEAGRMGVPNRREIGHGALAERAIMAVIPAKDKFPYTIRVVSEIMSSNGSTSMASTCGSTLALMDAGVPILKPVSGIAMGMMSDDKDYVILTDILGLEDFSGDMDFKVAGTEDGITAIQLDVKKPITIDQVKETFARAKVGRMHIMDKMLAPLPEPRQALSEYAPKIAQLTIPTEKIGEVIGPGGRVIKNIIATTGATVDVEDDGTVTISGTTDESVNQAREWVRGLTREVTVGEQFEGEVKRILPFGAFVEILPGKEGMVHVSHMAEDFVKNPNDVVQIGQQVKVKVIEIDDQGRINLTMRLDETPESGRERRNDDRGGDRGGDRGPRPERREQRDLSDRPQAAPHPLTQQFRRERQQNQGGGAGWKRSSNSRGGSRFGGSRSNDRRNSR